MSVVVTAEKSAKTESWFKTAKKAEKTEKADEQKKD